MKNYLVNRPSGRPGARAQIRSEAAAPPRADSARLPARLPASLAKRLRAASLAASFAKRLRAASLAAILAYVALFAQVAETHALPFTIYESVEESTITRGVTLEKITRLTADGWLSIDVVRVDLTDGNLGIDALYDSASTKSLATVKALAEKSGAVAAINGGFFVRESAGVGYATGAMMRAGQLDGAFGETNAFGDVMGSITVSGGSRSSALAGSQAAAPPEGETAVERRIRLKREAAARESAGQADADGSGSGSGSASASAAASGASASAAQAAMKALIGYARPSIALLGENGASLAVTSYNNYSFYDYRDVVILDRKWASHSVGASEKRPDIVELVVEDGKVRELRDAMPSVTIPANGFVAISRRKEDGSNPFGDAFRPGAPASFQAKLDPAPEGAVMHIEGASVLVKDGAIPGSFSYEPKDLTGRNPRTMVGVSKDGGQLIMVTADGRQPSSIGLDTRESAELMQSLGAHDALNLDGGGSTTMVARDVGEFGVELVNSVSDPSMRLVVNGIGVFTSAPKAAARGIVIEAAESNVFVGTNRQFTVKGFDRYGNPVEIDQKSVVWSISGFRGTIRNGLLRPRTAGDGFVSAKLGRATAKIAVKSLSGPAVLSLNQTSLSVGAGGTFTFAVTGRDSMGFSARINPADVAWSVSADFGSVENGAFTRAGGASGYITAALADARAYCAVQPLPPDGAPEASGGAGAPLTVELPKATAIKDSANVSADYVPSDGSFRFGVYGDPGGQDADAEKALGAAFAGAVNRELDIGVYVGNGSHASSADVKKTAVATGSKFAAYANFGGNPDAKLIQLSSVGNGIRAAGVYQWGSFLEELENFGGKDLFIALQQSPSTFSDKLEAALFKERLAHYSKAKGYRVWVFYGGTADSVWLEDGVRYFSCAGAASAANSGAASAPGGSYLRVTVQGGAVTYEFAGLA
jgi:hypothetical protein